MDRGVIFSAEGAFHPWPGPTPQGLFAKNMVSAESVIQFGLSSIYHRPHASIAEQSDPSHHLFHERPRTLARFRCGRGWMLIWPQSADFVSVGGVADHVHILSTLPRTLRQAELIERVKKTSSKWIKALDVRYRAFFWQRGYGVFSVSPSQPGSVGEYAKQQEEHHRRHTFQEEYREVLRNHNLEFDERYVWD